MSDVPDLDHDEREARGEFVQSLERGLAVMSAFGPGRTHLTLTEVAQHVGITRAAARRFLRTLVSLGYVRSDGRKFSLRPRVLELGYAYMSTMSLADIAQPFLDELIETIEESSSIAVPAGDELVYAAHAAPKRAVTINLLVGARDPLYCTSLGRVLLAARSDEEIDRYLRDVQLRPYTDATETDPARLRRELAKVRRLGYALVDHEFEDGLVALAIPVHDAAGRTIAAMNVSTYSLRVSATTLVSDYLAPLRACALELESELRSARRLHA